MDKIRYYNIPNKKKIFKNYTGWINRDVHDSQCTGDLIYMRDGQIVKDKNDCCFISTKAELIRKSKLGKLIYG